MTDFHPLSLSRQLADLASRRGGEAVALEPRRPGPSVFGAVPFPGRTTFERVRDLPEEEPLRAALLAWVAVLVDARVGAPEDAELLRLRFEERRPSVVLEREVSLRELGLALLGGRDGEREALLDERILRGRALGERRLERFEKAGETLRLLGLESFRAVEHPRLPDELESLARRALESSARLGERDGSPKAWLERRLAREASEGWPARLTDETILELLGLRSLGVRLGVRPGGLPSRSSPSSFLLAFERVARAFRRTRIDRGLPFVLGFDPCDLGGATVGDFVGLWASSPVFQRRRLDLGREASVTNARALLRAASRELDRRALALLVAREMSRGRRSAEELVAETTAALFGRPLELRQWVGLFPLRLSTEASFVALGLALAALERAIELDDEDFFESPRFQERFLAELATTPGPVEREEVERGISFLARTLAALV